MENENTNTENTNIENVNTNTEHTNASNTSNTTNTNTTSNYTIQEENSNIITLNTIHNDLGIITSFLCIASVVILIHIMYKFFRIFF